MYVYICISFALLGFSIAADRGSQCTTPNGESATCIPIDDCLEIKRAIAYLDEAAIAFARQSLCGYEQTPLVCCGSVGHVTTTPNPLEPTTKPQVLTNPKSTPNHVKHLRLPDSSLCGLQSAIHHNKDVTEVNEYPWMVALKYTKTDDSPGEFLCSGTLINQRYVLTAAQCLNITGYKLVEIRIAEWNFSSPLDCHKNYLDEEICLKAIDLSIIETIPHPFYSAKSGNNDIALLRVRDKIKYDDYVRPICLPPSDYEPPQDGTLMESSGWGFCQSGSITFPVKTKVEIPMVGYEECNKFFPNYTKFEPNQACAGGVPGKDPCIGDSGAPLLRRYIKEDSTDQAQWFQEGIIHQRPNCDKGSGPVLYTRVSNYINWIISHLKQS